MRAKRMSQVRLSVDCEAQCAHAGPRARDIAGRSGGNPSKGRRRKPEARWGQPKGSRRWRPGRRWRINPTAWQTAALGVEGSAALKRRQQRPMTGPENGAGTGRRARLAWPGLAEELRESPPCSGRPRGRLRMCAPNGLRRSRSSKCSFGSCP